MGIYVIRVPDIGEGIAEVELVAWHVQPGDVVAEDQPIADVMTDKATVEIPSPVAGKVLALGSAVGQSIAVGSELVRLEVEGEGNLKQNSAPAPAHQAQVATVLIASEAPSTPTPAATPAAPAAARPPAA
ncbi:MAG TPA: 2-oxo acid dehydrogenase subunit E2, partial [Giesbergeria sp.]|nr:2-oxo acid dehydrogenase subunit E2 [Giesbergeria sp.]